MADWQLTHTPPGGSPNTKTLVEWGVTGARKTLNSLQSDTVDLSFIPEDASSNTSAAPIGGEVSDWAFGDYISITKDAVQWFAGTLGNPQRDISTNHILRWPIDGPWKDLEEIQYFQIYGSTREDLTDPDNPTTAVDQIERGDVTLMQRWSGSGVPTVLTTGQQIEDLLNFALNRMPASFQLGVDAVLDGMFVDFVEARDETVANLIRKLAKWHPMANSWLEYNTTPPTMHFDEPSGQIDIDYSSPVDIQITEEADKIPPYVKLDYKAVNSLNIDGDHNSYVTTFTEFGGPPGFDEIAYTALDDHRRAIRATIDLDGSDANVVTQRVRARELPFSSDESNIDPEGDPPENRPPSDEWEKTVLDFLNEDDRLPWLNTMFPEGQAIENNIQVKSFVISKSEPSDKVEFPPPNPEDEDPEPVYELWETPRILDEGSDNPSSMNVKSQRIKIEYELLAIGDDIKKDKGILGHFNARGFSEKDGPTKLNHYPMASGSFTLVATSATSEFYSRTTAANAAEEPPTGIAQKLYDDLKVKAHTGTIKFTEDDLFPAGAARPGQLYNITNSQNPEWSDMLVQSQQVTEDIATGTTTISVGKPEQLGLNDLIKLMRLWRANPPSYTDNRQRTQGRLASANAEIRGGDRGPQTTHDGDQKVKIPLTLEIVKSATGSANAFSLVQEPGHIITQRSSDGTLIPPIMPTIDDGGQKPLDDDTRPKLGISPDIGVAYHEISFDANGNITGVELKTANTLPDANPGISEPEYRQLGKYDTTKDPPTLESEVEGSYSWPSKAGSAGGLTETLELSQITVIAREGSTPDECLHVFDDRYELTLPAGSFKRVVGAGQPPRLDEWLKACKEKPTESYCPEFVTVSGTGTLADGRYKLSQGTIADPAIYTRSPENELPAPNYAEVILAGNDPNDFWKIFLTNDVSGDEFNWHKDDTNPDGQAGCPPGSYTGALGTIGTATVVAG